MAWIFIGGFPIEDFRLAIDKRDKLDLLDKLFSIDLKKNETKEVYNSNQKIMTYDLSTKNFLAIGTLKIINREKLLTKH
jgi:hypothetical protein